MLTQEDLQVLRALMQEELKPIKKDITDMKQDISDIKEDLGEVRGATNYIAEWVERVENKVNNKAM